MKKQTQNYSPSEFMEKLAHDDFRPQSLVFTGMVKTAEDENHLLFANGADCANWTAIPLDVIENIELIDVLPCKDHTHPFVNISIREPTSDEAKMFASLARSQPFTSWQPPRMSYGRQGLQRPFRGPHFARQEFFRASGAGGSACWDRCIDDLLEFASRQPPEQFVFWSSIAYQLCGQVCP
ncbi:MAG TPA: hypothetical protein VLE49_02015 [Anaerolineales bacterium]|nr:hypothetical protein [Anaerolineales bacterium]